MLQMGDGTHLDEKAFEQTEVFVLIDRHYFDRHLAA
jgi:hypothetical protein